MRTHVIDHPHNEASALIAIHHQRLLDSFGWTVAFWIVRDEAPAEEALAALGRDRRGRWQVRQMKCSLSKRSTRRRTDDSESLARAGGWIYIIGSQFGAKDGPLDAHRHFLARFNESLVKVGRRKLGADIDVVRHDFLLHRRINDALARRKITLIARRADEQKVFIAPALAGADKSTRRRIRRGDRPINIEGATFLYNGRLLLGLRYPVTAAGQPIVVELDGVDRLFTKKHCEDVAVARVWVLKNVGTRAAPRGVRELDQCGNEVHVVTGNLDGEPRRSEVIHEHPEGRRAHAQHHKFDVPTDERVDVRCELVRSFAGVSTVEGFTLQHDGSTWYAHDDEKIRLDEAPPRRRRNRR